MKSLNHLVYEVALRNRRFGRCFSIRPLLLRCWQLSRSIVLGCQINWRSWTNTSTCSPNLCTFIQFLGVWIWGPCFRPGGLRSEPYSEIPLAMTPSTTDTLRVSRFEFGYQRSCFICSYFTVVSYTADWIPCQMKSHRWNSNRSDWAIGNQSYAFLQNRDLAVYNSTVYLIHNFEFGFLDFGFIQVGLGFHPRVSIFVQNMHLLSNSLHSSHCLISSGI